MPPTLVFFGVFLVVAAIFFAVVLGVSFVICRLLRLVFGRWLPRCDGGADGHQGSGLGVSAGSHGGFDGGGHGGFDGGCGGGGGSDGGCGV